MVVLMSWGSDLRKDFITDPSLHKSRKYLHCTHDGDPIPFFAIKHVKTVRAIYLAPSNFQLSQNTLRSESFVTFRTSIEINGEFKYFLCVVLRDRLHSDILLVAFSLQNLQFFIYL